MRLALGIMTAVCVFILVYDEPVRGQKYDVGVIEEMSEGNITSEGTMASTCSRQSELFVVRSGP